MGIKANDIASELRKSIRNGEIQAGEQLPTLAALVQRYGVSTQTARLAVTKLKTEGLVEHVGGQVGNVVKRQRPKLITRTRRMERDSAGYYCGPEVQDWARVAGTQTAIKTLPVPADIAALLAVAEGSELLVRSHLTGDPYKAEHRHITDTWIHPNISKALPMLSGATGLGGTQDRIEEWAQKPLVWSEIVTAHLPSPEEKQALLLPDQGEVVLRVLRTATLGRSPKVVTVDDIRMSARLFGLRYMLHRGLSAKWPVQPAGSDYYRRPPGAIHE